jgi:DNA-binding XRE family transcriptional regulator
LFIFLYNYDTDTGNEMNIKKILGANIKKYRSIAGITQEELSEKLDI